MTDAAHAHTAHARLQTLLKATVMGGDASGDSSGLGSPARRLSRQPGDDPQSMASLFAETGALEPPYDPEQLCLLVENSNALRQNLDAYAVNIDGFGYRLEPAVDLDAEDAGEQIALSLMMERDELTASHDPSAEAIAQRKVEIERLSRIEKARLHAFFACCAFDDSLVTLRRKTRQDLETTGNAYWEVLRNGRGEIARLVHVPSHTVRLLPLDTMVTEVEDRVPVSPITFETVRFARRLRGFVQLQGLGGAQSTDRMHFKAFGDPRVMSRKTGKSHATMQAFESETRRGGS